MPAVVGHTLIGRRHVNRRKAKTKKRIPSFVGEPRRCDGECGNDERRDSCCKCAVVPRHTSVIRKASLGRQARVTSFPGEGALRHSAACASMERSWSCRSMTFFSNHAMVIDWEMTSRSRWSAAASLANDCASVMICGSAFPPCDGAFDTFTAHDFRIEPRAGEDAGRPVAP